MRLLKKNIAIDWLVLLFAFLPAQVHAASDYGVSVIKAEAALSGEQYLLSADIDFKLSDRAIEALKNGVPLFWNYHFAVSEVGRFWNTALAEKNVRYRIQYHALLNAYRVRNETSGAVSNSYSLEAALADLSAVRDLPLLEKNKIDGEKDYQAGIKVTFDRDALPLPLRPVAYVNPQWYLSSDWYTWTLTK